MVGFERGEEILPEKIGSIKSNTGHGLGTLDENVIRTIFGVFHLGGWIQSGITRGRVGGGEWGCHHSKEKHQSFPGSTIKTKSNTRQGSGALAKGVLGRGLGAHHELQRLLASCILIGGGRIWYQERTMGPLSPWRAPFGIGAASAPGEPWEVDHLRGGCHPRGHLASFTLGAITSHY